MKERDIVDFTKMIETRMENGKEIGPMICYTHEKITKLERKDYE